MIGLSPLKSSRRWRSLLYGNDAASTRNAPEFRAVRNSAVLCQAATPRLSSKVPAPKQFLQIRSLSFLPHLLNHQGSWSEISVAHFADTHGWEMSGDCTNFDLYFGHNATTSTAFQRLALKFAEYRLSVRQNQAVCLRHLYSWNVGGWKVSGTSTDRKFQTWRLWRRTGNSPICLFLMFPNPRCTASFWTRSFRTWLSPLACIGGLTLPTSV